MAVDRVRVHEGKDELGQDACHVAEILEAENEVTGALILPGLKKADDRLSEVAAFVDQLRYAIRLR